eukprot:4889507-Amphidinium_carterae.1
MECLPGGFTPRSQGTPADHTNTLGVSREGYGYRIGVESKGEICSLRGAFMTSRPLQRESGELYASLPKLWLHPELANPLQLVLVKVAWYGLGDGPREFYESLSSEALQLGCNRHPLDPCTYLWLCDGHLQGVFGVTVVDMIGGGTELFLSSVMEPLKK